MTDISPIFDQIQLFITDHAPKVALDRASMTGAAMVLAGISLCMFGAKFAKPGVAIVLAAVGGGLGSIVGSSLGFSPLIGGLAGAAALGIVTLRTFHWWVAVATAMVFLSISLSALGYQRLVPHVADFQSVVAAPDAIVPADLTLPADGQAATSPHQTALQWGAKLWTFAKERDAQLAPMARGVALAAILVGLCVGVVAVRWMLILATSLAGTAMLAGGVATLVRGAVEEGPVSIAENPVLTGAAVGACLVVSLIVQTRLTRKPRPTQEAAAA